MRTVLVTGGAGFIGSHLAHALVARGDRVRVLDDLSTGKAANLNDVQKSVELIEGNIADAAVVERAVRGVELIFHEAAIASVPKSVEDPLTTHSACVTGTLNVLDAARRAGVRRVVYAASSAAYGDTPVSAKRETDLPAPISPYGAAKLAAEYYCQACAATYGIETVCLRYFNIFGPRQDPSSPYSGVISLFITALLAGRQPTIFGDGLQSRDFCYVGNVVQANLLAGEKPGVCGQVFNIGSGRATTLLELLETLGRLIGVQPEPKLAPPRAGDIRESLADITQARKFLGYEPTVGLEEGLEQTLDFYRQGERGA
jgi:UDP-N-acetylglucosamine/UDP-N-acetyl-alpha-D-glucosaminouronate 4-epimerase